MFDFSILLDANHAVLAEDGTFTLTDSAATEVTVGCISRIAGVEIFDESGVATLSPAVVVRVSELTENSITRSDLEDATLLFQSQTFTVKSTTPRVLPNGEDTGELYVWLEEL